MANAFKEGEVVIFNNKNFHAVEPWKLDAPRRNYIIRTMPLYDLGMAPSATFLNGVPCNRYQLINGRLSAVDPRDNGFEFHPIPEQSVT